MKKHVLGQKQTPQEPQDPKNRQAHNCENYLPTYCHKRDEVQKLEGICFARNFYNIFARIGEFRFYLLL